MILWRALNFVCCVPAASGLSSNFTVLRKDILLRSVRRSNIHGGDIFVLCWHFTQEIKWYLKVTTLPRSNSYHPHPHPHPHPHLHPHPQVLLTSMPTVWPPRTGCCISASRRTAPPTTRTSSSGSSRRSSAWPSLMLPVAQESTQVDWENLNMKHL